MYLQKDKVLLDNLLNAWITPEITVQHLTGKHSSFLNIDHEPLCFVLGNISALELIFQKERMAVSTAVL